ncbi:MAG: penicillin-binding protein activator [Nitrospirae bacterium]|nr:penicillin-binding protein activator [Candidatus Manganitrophaceae bacterium]
MKRSFFLSFISILFLSVSVGSAENPAKTTPVPPPTAQTPNLPAVVPPPSISSEEKSLFEQANTASASGNTEAALGLFDQFILKFPNSLLLPDIYLELAKIYADRGEMKRAIETLKTVLDRFPTYFRVNDARLQLSNLYLTMGELKEVMGLWSELPDQEASKVEIYERVAQAYLEQREFVEALQVLMQKRQLVIDPDAGGAVREEIVSIVKEKLPERELQAIIKQFTPSFPADEALVRLIALYDGRGDYYREEREIKRLLSTFPNHPFSTEARRLSTQVREKIKANRYLIGVVLPLSGKLAPYGNNALNGAQLAVQQFKELLPGASVGVVVRDLDEEPSRSVSALEQWLDDFRPVALVGPLLSKEVDRMVPVIEKTDLALITPGATSSRLASLGKSVFRNAMTSRFQCRAIAAHAVTGMNLKRFAILFPNESAGKEWAKCFSEEVGRLGGEIVHAEPYSLSDTDFSPTIRRMKEADLKKNGVAEVVQEGRKKKELTYFPGFDAIFLPGDADKAGLMIPQLAFHNIRDIPLLGTSGWDTPEFLKLVGSYAEGATFVDGFFLESVDPAIRKFVAQYRAKFQQEPDLFAAQAFDATHLILATLEGGALTPRDVKTMLAKTKDFPGVSGFIAEIRDGEAVKKPFLIQVQRGKLVQLN